MFGRKKIVIGKNYLYDVMNETDMADAATLVTVIRKKKKNKYMVMAVNNFKVFETDACFLYPYTNPKEASVIRCQYGTVEFSKNDIITLQEDVNMGSGDNDNLVINSENVTIDLGGKTLTANGSNGAVRVNGGVTTLDGAGTVSGTLGSDNYSMAVWASNGTVVINDGTYINMTDGSTRGTASGTGRIEINGGIFEAAKPEWTLNCKDVDYKAGTAKIIVKGGSFKGFDPANNNAEGAETNFVADGYKSVLEGEYYVVKPI